MSNFASRIFELPEDNPTGPETSENYIWGNLELMGGTIAIQFAPLTGTERVGLGRNHTSAEEIEKALDDLSEADLKRTIRTILRLVCSKIITKNLISA